MHHNRVLSAVIVGAMLFSTSMVMFSWFAKEFGDGTFVQRDPRTIVWLPAALVGLFAVFHGHAHGTELPEGANGALYSIGFVIATGSLHAAGIGIGTIHRFPRGRLVLRAAGALIAISGIYFLARGIGDGLF